jgi:hypothetical protein
MKNYIILLILPIFILYFSSCARMKISSVNLRNQVQFNPTSEPVKKHFKESKWNHYFLFQLVPTSEPKISEMLASHVAPGDKVVGLRVSKKMSFFNGLICVLIGLIYCPETTTIEGDVVAAGSLK